MAVSVQERECVNLRLPAAPLGERLVLEVVDPGAHTLRLDSFGRMLLFRVLHAPLCLAGLDGGAAQLLLLLQVTFPAQQRALRHTERR
jgi:hypothetical protein